MTFFLLNVHFERISHKAGGRMGKFSVIYKEKSFYIFGGYLTSNQHSNVIGRLDTKTMKWSKFGELNKGRCGHNAVEVQGQVLVIGGGDGNSNGVKTERCTFAKNGMNCSLQNPHLEHYWQYPELHIVSDNFCQ